MARSYTLADSADVANNVTSIAANYLATSNGTNLVARNLFDNNTYVGILNSKPFAFPEWTTAGRPTVANNRWGFNTTNNWLEGYSVSGWVAPAQAANADGKFLVGTIPYADANGRLRYGAYSDIYVSATDFVAYRAPLFSSNQSGIPGGLRIYNTNTTSGTGYASVALYPSTGGKFSQFFHTNTLYPGYGVISANSFGHYSTGTGGMAMQIDEPSASFRFGIGTTGTIEKMRMDANGLGLFTTATQELDVNGDVRVRDSLRLPILSSILQTEGSGWVKALTIGSGLSYSAGTLSSTATWLKTELEAGRDVDITGGASTDFRIRNTRIQFENKFKVGADSTFVHDATSDTLYNYGDVRFNLSGISNALRLNSTGLGIGRTATNSKLEVMGSGEFHGASGVTYIGAYGGSFPDPSAYNTGYIYNTNTRFGIFSGMGFSVNDDILLHATASKKVSIKAINDTMPGISISLSKATFIRERLIIAPDSTLKFDPTTDLLQLSQMGIGNKKASSLGFNKPTHLAAFSTTGIGQGTLLDYPLDSIPTNSIYNNLPNGDVNIDADGNILQIENMSELYLSTTDYAVLETDNTRIELDDDAINMTADSEIRLFANSGMSRMYVSEEDITNSVRTYNNTLDVRTYMDSSTYFISEFVGSVIDQKTHLAVDFDKSLTSHSLRPYDKYGLANETPVTGSGLKQSMVWTAGTPAFEYVKKDTTIYIDDADYDWSAAISTATIALKFNRVIFWMTTTGAAGSDSDLTLHTPDANLMQVEYLIHSVDEPAGFDNKIVFGSNNAVDSTNGLVTSYYPAAGDGIHIRAGLRSGVYKYRYSN